VETGFALKDEFFDLRGLCAYSKLGLSTLRGFIRDHGLPAYSIRNDKGVVTKILVKRSEFDIWMLKTWQQDLEALVDDVMDSLRGDQ
jgi:hypothetical protein